MDPNSPSRFLLPLCIAMSLGGELAAFLTFCGPILHFPVNTVKVISAYVKLDLPKPGTSCLPPHFSLTAASAHWPTSSMSSWPPSTQTALYRPRLLTLLTSEIIRSSHTSIRVPQPNKSIPCPLIHLLLFMYLTADTVNSCPWSKQWSLNTRELNLLVDQKWFKSQQTTKRCQGIVSVSDV